MLVLIFITFYFNLYIDFDEEYKDKTEDFGKFKESVNNSKY